MKFVCYRFMLVLVCSPIKKQYCWYFGISTLYNIMERSHYKYAVQRLNGKMLKLYVYMK